MKPFCGTCKHVDYSKTTTSKLWVECKLTGKRTALFTSTCEKWEEMEEVMQLINLRLFRDAMMTAKNGLFMRTVKGKEVYGNENRRMD